MATKIEAKVIQDSLGFMNDRVTTLLVTMPRTILAELNTHRMLTRNSASSRAIPHNKMLAAIEKDPYVPLVWQKEHSGMQGSELLDESDTWHSIESWKVAAKHATSMSVHLTERYHVSKQITNRLLEPFMWHKVLLTATEWENFVALRADKEAEPHMEILANCILKALNGSTPKKLALNSWHLPFGDQLAENLLLEEALKIVTARCAQTSYTMIGDNFEELNPNIYHKLIHIHDRLVLKGHWSPFEHPCRQMDKVEYYSYARCYQTYKISQRLQDESDQEKALITKVGDVYHVAEYGWCGNYRGWIQYRKSFENENRTDSRLIRYDYNQSAVTF